MTTEILKVFACVSRVRLKTNLKKAIDMYSPRLGIKFEVVLSQ